MAPDYERIGDLRLVICDQGDQATLAVFTIHDSQIV
jgi:hypothetical protein